jgi:protein-disulfide isomerase
MVVALAGQPTAWAGDPSKSLSTEEIKTIVHDYIMAHPEVIMESVQLLRDREQAEKKEHAKAALVTRQSELFNDPAAPVEGRTADAVRIVEFFDYRCGFCKRVDPTVMTLLKHNPNVQVIFKEFPILGPESLLAAKAALAAHRQGAYLKFHTSLMGSNDPVTQESLENLAGLMNLDLARFKADMAAPDIHESIERNQQLAQALGISSTPTFVIESELVEGAMDAEALNKLIEKIRADKAAR